MTAVPRPGAEEPDTVPRLTIGEVLARLRGEFPDITISKIRYLEAEELVHPQRTPSGYRKFSDADVDRLRYVLAAQRDQYLPLRVIKEHLDALDRGEPLPGSTGAAEEPELLADVDARAALEPADFAEAAGLDAGQLADCVEYGLVGMDTAGRHPATDLPVARAVAGLARHGIEPRHLRMYRSAAERESGLLEQVVAPLLRGRSDDARGRATEQLREIAALSAQLSAGLLEARLREVLRG